MRSHFGLTVGLFLVLIVLSYNMQDVEATCNKVCTPKGCKYITEVGGDCKKVCGRRGCRYVRSISSDIESPPAEEANFLRGPDSPTIEAVDSVNRGFRF